MQATPIGDGKVRYTEVLEPLTRDGKPVFADGKPVLVPVWETVRSPREDIYHDPVAHGVTTQQQMALRDESEAAA
jgi:hypothetical protein